MYDINGKKVPVLSWITDFSWLTVEPGGIGTLVTFPVSERTLTVIVDIIVVVWANAKRKAKACVQLFARLPLLDNLNARVTEAIHSATSSREKKKVTSPTDYLENNSKTFRLVGKRFWTEVVD